MKCDIPSSFGVEMSSHVAHRAGRRDVLSIIISKIVENCRAVNCCCHEP